MERLYRNVISPEGLVSYSVKIGESDLFICTSSNLRSLAEAALARYRSDIEEYMKAHPIFGRSFKPVPGVFGAPEIVKDMAYAAEVFDVGPMASVAGAIAQHVGVELKKKSKEVIVENGGDIFLAGGRRRKVRIFPGNLSQTLDIIIEDEEEGLGLCTSSAKVGPSISLGNADAVTVLAKTATLADAAATAIGNRVHSAEDIEDALYYAKSNSSILGVVIIVGGAMGVWGGIEIV